MRRTQSTSNRAALLAVPLLLAACGPPAPAAPSPNQVADEIEAMLHASAEAWTAGDLEGYLDDYATDATFVGSSGLVRGRSRIGRLYRDGYWSSGTPEDGLRFRALEVRPVDDGAALAVGRYELFDRSTGGTTSAGTFSLTLRRAAGGWEIVHDHSSADPSG